MPTQLVRYNIFFFIASGLFLAAAGIYGFFQFGSLQGQNASLSGLLTAKVTPNPLAVEIFVPDNATVAKPFSVKAAVTNLGEVAVENTTAEIFLPSGLTLSGHNSLKKLGRIDRQSTRQASWQIRANSSGSYVVSVSVSGMISGELAPKDASAIVVVGTKVKPPGNIAELVIFFQNILAGLLGLRE